MTPNDPILAVFPTPMLPLSIAEIFTMLDNLDNFR